MMEGGYKSHTTTNDADVSHRKKEEDRGKKLQDVVSSFMEEQEKKVAIKKKETVVGVKNGKDEATTTNSGEEEDKSTSIPSSSVSSSSLEQQLFHFLFSSSSEARKVPVDLPSWMYQTLLLTGVDGNNSATINKNKKEDDQNNDNNNDGNNNDNNNGPHNSIISIWKSKLMQIGYLLQSNNTNTRGEKEEEEDVMTTMDPFEVHSIAVESLNAYMLSESYYDTHNNNSNCGPPSPLQQLSFVTVCLLLCAWSLRIIRDHKSKYRKRFKRCKSLCFETLYLFQRYVVEEGINNITHQITKAMAAAQHDDDDEEESYDEEQDDDDDVNGSNKNNCSDDDDHHRHNHQYLSSLFASMAIIVPLWVEHIVPSCSNLMNILIDEHHNIRDKNNSDSNSSSSAMRSHHKNDETKFIIQREVFIHGVIGTTSRLHKLLLLSCVTNYIKVSVSTMKNRNNVSSHRDNTSNSSEHDGDCFDLVTLNLNNEGGGCNNNSKNDCSSTITADRNSSDDKGAAFIYHYREIVQYCVQLLLNIGQGIIICDTQKLNRRNSINATTFGCGTNIWCHPWRIEAIKHQVIQRNKKQKRDDQRLHSSNSIQKQPQENQCTNNTYESDTEEIISLHIIKEQQIKDRFTIFGTEKKWIQNEIEVFVNNNSNCDDSDRIEGNDNIISNAILNNTDWHSIHTEWDTVGISTMSLLEYIHSRPLVYSFQYKWYLFFPHVSILLMFEGSDGGSSIFESQFYHHHAYSFLDQLMESIPPQSLFLTNHFSRNYSFVQKKKSNHVSLNHPVYKTLLLLSNRLMLSHVPNNSISNTLFKAPTSSAIFIKMTSILQLYNAKDQFSIVKQLVMDCSIAVAKMEREQNRHGDENENESGSDNESDMTDSCKNYDENNTNHLNFRSYFSNVVYSQIRLLLPKFLDLLRPLIVTTPVVVAPTMSASSSLNNSNNNNNNDLLQELFQWLEEEFIQKQMRTFCYYDDDTITTTTSTNGGNEDTLAKCVERKKRLLHVVRLLEKVELYVSVLNLIRLLVFKKNRLTNNYNGTDDDDDDDEDAFQGSATRYHHILTQFYESITYDLELWNSSSELEQLVQPPDNYYRLSLLQHALETVLFP